MTFYNLYLQHPVHWSARHTSLQTRNSHSIEIRLQIRMRPHRFNGSLDGQAGKCLTHLFSQVCNRAYSAPTSQPSMTVSPTAREFWSIRQYFFLAEPGNNIGGRRWLLWHNTVLAVNNVAWYISMSYAKGDHCKIEFKVGMCEGECYTRDLAALSSVTGPGQKNLVPQ